MKCDNEIEQAANTLRCNLEFIQLGVSALRGLGGVLSPENHDYQLNGALASEISAVFSFFGEALEQPSIMAYNAYEAMERIAMKGQSNA